jgi:hypothetical protein
MGRFLGFILALFNVQNIEISLVFISTSVLVFDCKWKGKKEVPLDVLLRWASDKKFLSFLLDDTSVRERDEKFLSSLLDSTSR